MIEGLLYHVIFRRRLTDKELMSLRVNPWQLFWRNHPAALTDRCGGSMRSRRKRFFWRIK